ncbi:MAG TPA: tRNA-uridine aminocarboxypropyltransferase [Candidatus Binatia bacterium]|nr:tRNA-uridine aminocarboxypropyltransferase [Candidatus Binatia bacterium]
MRRLSPPPRRARAWCALCRRAAVACYCSEVRPLESWPRFVILSQPKESRHSFGTGRMAHRCLANSLLLVGVDFSANTEVNAIIHDPQVWPVLLYPGPASFNLSKFSVAQREALVPPGRDLVVFVPDGTWKSVRKMTRLSQNLQALPSISFDIPSPSRYRVRRQPQPNYTSTLEAIHHVIDLLTPAPMGNSAHNRPHDRLLEVFEFAVSRQLWRRAGSEEPQTSDTDAAREP